MRKVSLTPNYNLSIMEEDLKLIELALKEIWGDNARVCKKHV